jgi:hypothetical protein
MAPRTRSSSLALGSLVLATAACSSAAVAPLVVVDGGDARAPDASADHASPPRVSQTAASESVDAAVDEAMDAADATTPAVAKTAHASSSACAPLSIDSTSLVDGTASDTFTWSDATCAPRSAALFRNDAVDHFGEAGGYVRRFTYVDGPTTRTCTGTGENGWNGFGYVVTHYGTGTADTNTQNTLGLTSTVLAGRHHAIEEFRWATSPGGPVNVTAQWFVATGRSHPLFIVTFDATPAGANAVLADSRAPYGDIGWDDDAVGPVEGVGWGDHYRFTTTGSGPVTSTSSWDYSTTNLVPYALEWSTSADAEMGLVATLPWTTRIAGGDYGAGLLQASWGATGTNLLAALPEWLWPFQLNQYELLEETTSHRIAWGATFGAVGQSTYEAFGHPESGYPFQSYSVFVVLGVHSPSAVALMTDDVEAASKATVTASVGTVSTRGPAGIGRTDTTTYEPAGFDPVYAAWDATLAKNTARLTLSSVSPLTNPIFHLHGYTASTPPESVTWNGVALTADSDYFASVDPSTRSLWLTLGTSVTGTGTLGVGL